MAIIKADSATAAAVELARAAAEEFAGDFGVGEHMACTAEDERVVVHSFACPHPGYAGWHWAVTLVRANRAKEITVNDVVLLPGEGALQAPEWVPWSERIQPGDVGPGFLLPTPDNDPRLEPGFTGGEIADLDPAEASQIRAVVTELGLGRERLLSDFGRQTAAERWLDGDGGPDNALTHQAPASCLSCGYFVRLRGPLGTVFGACANAYSPSDGRVVSFDHGCGAHSDVVAEERGTELPEPIWDTMTTDQSLFD